jgi:hypothetical protein
MAAQRAVYDFRVACKIWQEHADACARALLNLTATQPDLSPVVLDGLMSREAARGRKMAMRILCAHPAFRVLEMTLSQLGEKQIAPDEATVRPYWRESYVCEGGKSMKPRDST